MDLSIIIVNWNTKDYLEQCLQSIFERTKGIEYEVFVVDNASTDGSAQMVKEKFHQVKLIENKKNVGFARANNQGMKKSSGKYILLLNSDTKIIGNALEKTIEFMNKNSEVAVVGCRLLNLDMSIQKSIGNFPGIGQTILDATLIGAPYRKFINQRIKHLKDPIEVDCVAGAFLLTRRKAVEKVGFLDEDYFIYSEDIDWCYRLKRKAGKIFYFPNAEVIHYGGESMKQQAENTFLELYKSKLIFSRKHYGKLKILVIKLILIIDVWLKLLWWKILYLFSFKKNLFIKNYNKRLSLLKILTK